MNNSVLRSLRILENYLKKAKGGKDVEQWLVYLMALIEPLGAQESTKTAERFNLRKEDRKKIRQSKSLRALIRRLKKPGLRNSQIYDLLHGLGEEVLILLLNRPGRGMVRSRVELYCSTLRDIIPQVTGEDLNALGFPPGQKVGRILKDIRISKMDKGVPRTRKEELMFAKRLTV